MIEYLLKLYAEYQKKLKTAKDKEDGYEYAYYDAKTGLIFEIMQEFFGLVIRKSKDSDGVTHYYVDVTELVTKSAQKR